MSQTPQVTVLMSVFNDAAFLPETVHGILSQSFPDFEFLIIDDGSTDTTPRYLANLADARLRVVRNETNQGLTRALRRGVELARGKYIARLDADDVALPKRLERQVRFLEERPECAIVGSGCLMVDENGRRLGLQRQPQSDLAIRWTSLLANPFVHSTVMMRRQVLTENGLNYDEDYDTTQDYELWTRLLRYGKGANLSTPLIRYCVRSGVTRKKRERQLERTRFVATRTIQTEMPNCSLHPDELRDLLDLPYPELWSRCARPAGIADLVKLQCQLYRDFAAKYHSHPGLAALRRWHFAQTIRFLCRSGFPPGWARTCALVLRQEPLAPAWAGLWVFRALADRVSAVWVSRTARKNATVNKI